MNVGFHSDAKAEIAGAIQYLDAQATGLGMRFFDEFAEALNSILKRPESFPKVETLPDDRPYRRALLRKFRYAVIFEHTDEHIWVMAVVHTSRQPNYWLGRSHP